MIADPFTKVMKADRLVKTFMTGKFDMKPTAESLMIKEKNRQYRKRLRDEKDGIDGYGEALNKNVKS